MRTSSVPIEPRKTSFMYPNPDVEAKIIERSLNEDFSDVSWKQLVLRRCLVFLLMLCIFTIGLLCRLFVPIRDYKSIDPESFYNATFNITDTPSFLNMSTAGFYGDA